jgi:RNA polymerase sigma-70 factor (ECF subfamily)
VLTARDDREGFEAFYAVHRAWLVRALRPIVGDEAEDVAQDAMIELFRRWDFISRYDSPEGWLRRIAIRAAVRRRARNIDRPTFERIDAVLEGRGGAVEDAAVSLVTSVLAGLSEADRQVLVLHDLADRPLGEVAERLGTTEVATRVRLLRARRRASEGIAGLHGTWVMERTWARDALANALDDRGFGSAAEYVMDDLEECGPIRTHLRLQDGRFLLTNRASMHLDHGRYVFDGRRLTLHSDGFPGGVVHSATADADELVLRQVENHNPSVQGAPDAAFQFALLGSSALRWQPSSPEPIRSAIPA